VSDIVVLWENNRKGTAFRGTFKRFVYRNKWKLLKIRNHCNLSLNFYSIYRIIEACESYLSNMHQIPSKTSHRAHIVKKIFINWQDPAARIRDPSYEIAKFYCKMILMIILIFINLKICRIDDIKKKTNMKSISFFGLNIWEWKNILESINVLLNCWNSSCSDLKLIVILILSMNCALILKIQHQWTDNR